MRTRIAFCVVVAMTLVACGRDESSQSGETDEPAAAKQDLSTANCGEGGTFCPEGLECLTWQQGRQACGPPAAPAVVLIKDGTLGGRCLSPTSADPYPGASIASLQIVAVDGSIKGYGRLAWENPGFEVAAVRGTPPDGSTPSGDACTSSYNLGCDGQAVFEIVDDGNVQPLREGELLIAHIRGQDACDEQVADEIEAAVCTDPVAAKRGDLASCTSRVRMVQARSDLYGSDRIGGTLGSLISR
jgi:hypothetical protein